MPPIDKHAPYGYCPICSKPGVSLQDGGRTYCLGGHLFLTSMAMKNPEDRTAPMLVIHLERLRDILTKSMCDCRDCDGSHVNSACDSCLEKIQLRTVIIKALKKGE